jgi:hypothetical protein
MTDHVTAEDVQYVDNVLADTGLPAVSRRSLLSRAAVGAAAVGGLGAFGPISSALASGESTTEIINTAATAEALAVTYLTRLVANAPGHGIPHNLVPVLKAANQAEYDHYKVLTGAGAQPLTKKFWIPNYFFHHKDVFPVIETAETLFVNAYLIAITDFAQTKQDTLARYAGEILGVEAEHRTLARFAQGKLPNNVGFEAYRYSKLSDVVGALEKAGVGFGAKGSTPGRFYEFRAPSRHTTTRLEHNVPA